MLKSEADRLRRVIVSTPNREYYRIGNLKQHNIYEVANKENALKQHNRLKELLSNFGSFVIDVPELKNHPNSVFTRDSAICTPEGYIQLFPGIVTRQAEGAWMASNLDGIGERCVGKINYPGTVDGGDVLLLDHVAFVGISKRTNSEGCRQLSHYLGKMGYEIRRISFTDSILHLDKVVMPVYPEKLLVCTNIVPQDVLYGFDIVAINYNENSSANIICLGDGVLIVGDTNREAIDALDSQELKINLIDISEFVKGAGGPNCLIMPIERECT